MKSFLATATLLIALLVPGSGSAGTDTPPYALIYNGPASAPDAPEAMGAVAEAAGLPVRYVADPARLPDLLPRAAVFVVGGTEEDMAPLVDGFTEASRNALKRYLQEGGRYLGICGGGFLASPGWEENGKWVRTLGILPADVEDLDEDRSPRALPIRWGGATSLLYFQGGPVFVPQESSRDLRIVATYEDGRVAALFCSYGRGWMAVSGPHPEARESWREGMEASSAWRPTPELAVALLRELLAKAPARP